MHDELAKKQAQLADSLLHSGAEFAGVNSDRLAEVRKILYRKRMRSVFRTLRIAEDTIEDFPGNFARYASAHPEVPNKNPTEDALQFLHWLNSASKELWELSIHLELQLGRRIMLRQTPGGSFLGVRVLGFSGRVFRLRGIVGKLLGRSNRP